MMLFYYESKKRKYFLDTPPPPKKGAGIPTVANMDRLHAHVLIYTSSL